jgi:hypothetical protein
VTWASERSRTGLATVGSPYPPDAAPKAGEALWTTSNWAQTVGLGGPFVQSWQGGWPFRKPDPATHLPLVQSRLGASQLRIFKEPSQRN